VTAIALTPPLVGGWLLGYGLIVAALLWVLARTVAHREIVPGGGQ
jgi:hypothetical protein